VAGISANITTVAGISSDVTTVATNEASVNRYSDEYTISASAPSSPSEGDLWYDSTSNILKVHNGTSFVAVTSATAGITDVVDDTTPSLGGSLDVNGNSIVSVTNGDIAITPNGTGDVIIDGLKHPQADGTTGQYIKTDGAGQLSFGTISTALDSPSITGTLSIDSGGTVTHTIGNWSEELTYVITPTNCTVGSINTSGEFVITHTSGVPSYTIKATTDNLGLDDSSLVTKNMVVKLTAPTISSPADTTVTTNVVYTVTSTDSGDDKIILDMGTSNFTYQSVDVGSGSKVGNTVEVTGFTTGNPAITVQFTALGTYADVKAKSTNIAGTYGDSNYSSSDSIVCYEQLSAPSLNAPTDSDTATAVTYTISSIDSNATKVIFDTQSSNFTYGSVGSGTGTKVGNTVEITGWSGTSVTVTLTYTTAATYSNRANVTSTSATYTDSAYSSSDSIVISASYAFQGSSYGFTAGGWTSSASNVIDKFSFSSNTTASDHGDLVQNTEVPAGQSSTTHGFSSGGYTTGSNTNTIVKFAFSSNTTASDHGDLYSPIRGAAGHSSETHGFISGGYHSGYINPINKFAFSSNTTASDHGDLSQSRGFVAGISSTDYGFSAGGNVAPVSDTTDRFSYTSNTTATDWGNLSVAREQLSGSSSSTQGFAVGGNAGGVYNTIDKFSFTSNTTAADHGDLSVARNHLAGLSETNNGFTAGGHSSYVTNVIDKFNHSSNTTASDHGDLSVSKRASSGSQY
jgi:hypothetical protein